MSEVLEYAEGADLEELERLRDAELAGKARSTLLSELERLIEEAEG